MTAPRPPSSPSGDPHRASFRVGVGVLAAALAATLAAPIAGVGCSEPAPDNEFTTGTGTGTDTGTDTSTGGHGGSGGGGDIFPDGGIQQPMYVSPASPIMKVELPLNGQTIPFQCMDSGSNLPIPDATWKISTLELGTLSDTGSFSPTGLRTGTAVVSCEKGEAKAETMLKVIIHAMDNPGGISQAQIDVLRGPPGQPDPAWKFLYPYDQTVFPRGILAPEVHLTQGSSAGSGFYLHIVATDYEYEGFFNTSASTTQLQMSQTAWEALTNSASGTSVEVHVSKLYNAQKYGPIFRTWKLASGKLHGTVYYNTYDSPLAGGNGAIMRVKGSSPTPEVLLGNCVVCHSIAADGSTAAAASGGTFDLSGGQVNPPVVWSEFERAAFAALFPKQGAVLVVNGAPAPSWPPNTPGTNAMWASELRTKAGTLIPDSGVEGYYAQSPVFSHDGTKLAFTDRQPVSPYPSVLAMLDYDELTQKFSNYQVLATPQPGRHLSWPAFTPDGKYVVYQDGVGEDLATWQGNTGKLFAVNTQSKVVTYLGRLNGDDYVPAGARDRNRNYEPTIAPIASGGYFWLMFTSRRTYGNKLLGDEGSTKRLWVSAFSVNAADDTDGSHPPFYLAGQELTSGNSRGFWALDPCLADGVSCESGDECCNGFCNPTGDPPAFVCGPPDGSCSDEFEGCTTAADCCAQSPALECIGGKCTALPPE